MDPVNAFDAAFLYLIANEGQIAVNDPVDRGGLTKYGITQKAWSVFRKIPSQKFLPPLADMTWPNWSEDVSKISAAQAKVLYQYMYWPTPSKAQASEIATTWFDASVLIGPQSSNRLMQQAVNAASNPSPMLALDGIIGTKSLEAINNANLNGLLSSFSFECQKYFLKIILTDNTQRKFLRTWLRRACAYQEFCHSVP